jgi:hypothetical protein
MRGSRGGDALAPLAIELPAPMMVSESREPEIVEGLSIHATEYRIRILTAFAEVVTPSGYEADMQMTLERGGGGRLAIFPATEPQPPMTIRYYTWAATPPAANAASGAVLCPIPAELVLPLGASAYIVRRVGSGEIEHPIWMIERG